MLKYLNSYTFLSLFEAITLNQSLTLCFFRYFLVRYFKYLLLMADSEETVTEWVGPLRCRQKLLTEEDAIAGTWRTWAIGESKPQLRSMS